MLKIDGVWKTFGGITALMDVSFNVEHQEIKAVIGPNGAGKTTLFNVVSGVFKPERGEIFFGGNKINGFGSVKIARLGISRTFQNVELYKNMTVLENVMVGRYARTKAGFFSCGFRLPHMVKEERETKKISEELLEYVGLYDKKDYLAGELPIGSQRILEIARALATEPKLIMFDEPASGLNDAETKSLSSFIKRLRSEKNLTIVLVEHDMNLVMDISDNIVVLNFGEKIAEGTPEEIRNNKLVIDAYLGEEEELF